MAFSLLQTLRDIPLAFLDVETTGASADFGHRVIELGICRVEGGRIVGEYQQLIDPKRRIGPGITALTGISQSMVDGQPTFAEQLPRAMDLMRGAAILGHNVRFDLSFLAKEFSRAGQDMPTVLGDVPVMDTVRIARRRFGRGGNGLQRLAPKLGVVPSAAHRALADAQTTAAVFEKLMAPVGGWDVCLCDALREQGGPMGLLPLNPRESLLPLELEEALDQRCAVMMEYLDANAQRTQRMIEPLHVRRASGELMLVAFCHLRQDRRTFKLERIVRLTRVEAEAEPTRLLVGQTFLSVSGIPARIGIKDGQECPADEMTDRNVCPTTRMPSSCDDRQECLSHHKECPADEMTDRNVCPTVHLPHEDRPHHVATADAPRTKIDPDREPAPRAADDPGRV